MPDKPFTVLTYAASASLAAIALVYLFNPNYLIDGEAAASSASARKKGVVGLVNPANDCFINSVLQSLAGLGDFRLYLIRELHRRKLDGPDIYATVPDADKSGKPIDRKKLLSLQCGEVTRGLKEMIDSLNERPIYKKTISAGQFIGVLEHAFGTRISKSQQDAQELLQVVAERLSEEYHAGREARKRARDGTRGFNDIEGITAQGLGLSLEQRQSLELPENSATPTATGTAEIGEIASVDDGDGEAGFPLEGRTESQIECQYCHFIPKTNPVTFVTLTLTVPRKSSSTLSECFDSYFKNEYIEDYKCDKCRLEHALTTFSADLTHAKSESHRAAILSDIAKVKQALAEDPEKPPAGIKLPDSKYAPNRKIARHVQIVDFPKILVIHLQRSIYDANSNSTKNAAKVSFPERLPIGGLINRRNYKLLGVVTHKGTHNSGHYESMRRQHLYAPTLHVQNPNSPYSAVPSPDPSRIPSPNLPPQSSVIEDAAFTSGTRHHLSPSTVSSSPSFASAALSPSSTRPSSGSGSGIISAKRSMQSAAGIPHNHATHTTPPPRRESEISEPNVRRASKADIAKIKRKKQDNDRWWRISDDKIRECKTSDVLGMQKEVYMLFYEIEKA
ncbi:hypothetical protein MMC19_004275 [Ptychographa xylographoides]|nr:hypothetical protein [Ptychographa xylographoides]